MHDRNHPLAYRLEISQKNIGQQAATRVNSYASKSSNRRKALQKESSPLTRASFLEMPVKPTDCAGFLFQAGLRVPMATTHSFIAG